MPIMYQILSSFGEVFASTAAVDFTPHVVTVNTGEDVGGKILSFARKSPRAICILSANGAISKVTLRQLGSSGGGILTYEGRFEILSLSGSYTVSDTSGIRTRDGGSSVSLAGPDGRVIGGSVAGLLTAAGPIQIVVGSFTPDANKTLKKKYQREHTVSSPTSTGPEIMTAARPISQANAHAESFMIPILSQLPDHQNQSCNQTNAPFFHCSKKAATMRQLDLGAFWPEEWFWPMVLQKLCSQPLSLLQQLLFGFVLWNCS
ncbi:hypothetical protein KIW84_073206 [Lathyrus oleraceus]|uniref:AT-hook motif nuclear-localized protein n=1 Tax=Pisum sativum TaxID=3888 RepID=A0A9D4VN86_PEA|nr:hypothetical protein KIW84_073206 [Pisum sativum]